MTQARRQRRLFLAYAMVGVAIQLAGGCRPWRDTTMASTEAYKAIDEGAEIVRALQAYRGDVGLWPERLDELTPKLVRTVAAGWSYSRLTPLHPWRLEKQLSDGSKVFASRIGSHWFLEFGRATHQVRDRPVIIDSPNVAGDRGLMDNALAELARRVARDPENFYHWAGRVSLLIQAGRLEEAIDVCEACARELPDHWWPRAVRAKLMLGNELRLHGVVEYSNWCELHPSYRSYWRLSLLYREAGSVHDALDALEKMTRHPLDHEDRELLGLHSNWYIAYDAGAFAYVHERPDLVLSLGESGPDALYNTESVSQLSLTSLALLAVKDFAGAEELLDRLPVADVPDCAVCSMDSVRQAVQERDSRYTHTDLRPPLKELAGYLIEYE